jgi:hypothetical protein
VKKGDRPRICRHCGKSRSKHKARLIGKGLRCPGHETFYESPLGVVSEEDKVAKALEATRQRNARARHKEWSPPS